MFNSTSVDKQKIGDQVLIILRKSIMLGEIKAGTHLKETGISKELGVSRGPIREAIAQLEHEGLVITPSNGRTVVAGFSDVDIENLYNTRILIEKYAISQLTNEAIERGTEELSSYVDLMKKAVNNGGRDVDADLLFHYLLVALTSNKSLIQAWKSLNGLIKTLIQITSFYAQEEVVHEHETIVKHLKSFEISNAQIELEKHLLAAREFYKDAVKQLREDEDA